MKKLLIVIAIMFCFIIPVSADSSMYADSVKVDIVVNENNSFDITETININFLTSHHGILRSLPTVNTVVRENGVKTTNFARITGIKVNEEFETETDGSDLVIKIGDPDAYISGNKQYVISYNYDIGNDPLSGLDEFYYNVIGTEWDYDIKSLDVVIHMPKDFDFSKLGVSHGAYGTVDYSGVTQERIGNDIILRKADGLNSHEAFTVRLELEEGYFAKRSNIMALITLILSPLLALVSLVLGRIAYSKYGKKDPVVEVVEFYPPNNLTPPRLVKQESDVASGESVNSLLIMLAEKGYLTIEDTEDENYRINIIRQPDGRLSEEEKLYLEGLIERVSNDEGLAYVEKSDLKNSFYHVIDEIRRHIDETTPSIYTPGQVSRAIPTAIVGIALIALPPILFSIAKTATIFQIEVFFHLKLHELLLLLFCIISGIILVITAACYGRRTPDNNLLIGRIRGFRNFIETAEKDRIEVLVHQNPNYFYDILPYAYALGVSSAWIDRFEDMMIEPPRWYYGNNFHTFMSDTMTDISSAAVSGGSSDSSSSGGGVSGGGSGGGGSSGW